MNSEIRCIYSPYHDDLYESRRKAYEAIANVWNTHNIQYAVVHGIENYPAKLGRDLDVLVSSSQCGEAFRLSIQYLKRNGYSVICPPRTWGPRILARHGGDWSQLIEIHFMTFLSYHGIDFIDKCDSISNIGPFKISFVASWIKQVICPFFAGEIERAKNNMFFFRDHTQEGFISNRLKRIFGIKDLNRFIEALRSGNEEALQSMYIYLRRKIIKRSAIFYPFSFSVNIVKRMCRWIARPFSSNAPIVAIVGPDGVGKSTIINQMSKEYPNIFTGVVCRHWRPGILPALESLLRKDKNQQSNNTSGPPRRTGGALAGIRTIYYAIDHILGYWAKDRFIVSKGTTVIYDRYFWDMIVDPLRFGLKTSFYARMISFLIPKPDFTFVLYDDKDAIYKRKAELPVEEIDRQLKLWKEISSRYKLNIIKVDCEPRELALRVWSAVITGIFQNRLGWKVESDCQPI